MSLNQQSFQIHPRGPTRKWTRLQIKQRELTCIPLRMWRSFLFGFRGVTKSLSPSSGVDVVSVSQRSRLLRLLLLEKGLSCLSSISAPHFNAIHHFELLTFPGLSRQTPAQHALSVSNFPYLRRDDSQTRLRCRERWESGSFF